MSEGTFTYDVFLSHSSKDKAIVRDIAERLRKDGVKVWFDEWVIKPGDSIPSKVEEGLEYSRVLVLCMSANAFSSDWKLEASTFRFRDPLNKERRFIPLRLDDAPIKGSLAQFPYINWRPAKQEGEGVAWIGFQPVAADVSQTSLRKTRLAETGRARLIESASKKKVIRQENKTESFGKLAAQLSNAGGSSLYQEPTPFPAGVR